ncbi:hypothetical protein JJC03_04780 [Flavobacterium oreochromis]|uniref:hypothetical protein n=1 Tax=Flavobacterium oreochromis TaxID=2906078 RepID=UPI001CE56696|nr:hypothetical protein [Flavobacterium oreochromis]QYS87212.1 hypothetical protein JJC03_04525 [Flavobacterium oreochromis]QYS87221.1 hypothetical protein JJC03_04590 [Flavobacterium oreochromis]QYS87251.1 hypothetical protein JJC03_04780 [Flavobacterium oreochromis]
MSTTVTRNYGGKDVDMLIACSTLIENAILYKRHLQEKRKTWTDEFFSNLQDKISKALEEHLGIDSAKDLRNATSFLETIQVMAENDLAEVKIQIIEDFKKDSVRKLEILNQLGFSSYKKGSQEGLVQILYQFKTNLTDALRDELSAKGIDVIVLYNITTYADKLKEANVTQETFKGTRKVMTLEAVTLFNEIYDDVISVAKISAKLFKEEPVKAQLFSYRKIQATLKNKKLSATQPEPAQQ